MKAVVVSAPRTLSVETVPDPEPTPEQLVLRVGACGICGSDLHAHQMGILPVGSVMGHEFAGEVVESRHGWKAGDRACALPALSCGRCDRCLTGLGVFCLHGMKGLGLGQAQGAYAEYVAVSPHHLVRLPEGVETRLGALVEPLAVGLHAANVARLRAGENVLVMGAGPIGLSTLLWARHFGARSVIVSEKSPGRRAMAERFGASAAVDPGDLLSATQRVAPGGIDVVFEAVGVPGLIAQAINSVKFRGRVVVVGVCMQPDQIFPFFAITKEASLHFVLAYEKPDFQYAVDMLDQGRIEPRGMITDEIALEAVGGAFVALETPTTQSKVLVVP
ncbi:MAG TPA: zinc-binding dehydrogenase [Myxococcota bacterium]|jgi:(R,R)-butanediol dehydrogenase/meso-butanediol dehydrogenase/diacetyl reductase|nr:zinc-binding dehydrogenase [Myxococcota bacterium]